MTRVIASHVGDKYSTRIYTANMALQEQYQGIIEELEKKRKDALVRIAMNPLIGRYEEFREIIGSYATEDEIMSTWGNVQRVEDAMWIEEVVK